MNTLTAEQVVAAVRAGASFEDHTLYALDLRERSLRGARFAGARLVNVKLDGADLFGADLTDAHLDGGLAEHARVVCLSSVSGLAGNVGQTNYAASKAGVVGYVRALAPRVAARGITVNAVAPGFIETRLTAAMPVATREVARRLSALGQGGEPRDIADLVCFLASPGASGLTGRSLRACGGMFIGA